MAHSRRIAIPAADVRFVAVAVDPDVVRDLARMGGYQVIARPAAHMTLHYGLSAEELDAYDIGREVMLRIVGVGELRDKKGNLTNVGLLVDDREHLSRNRVAHITAGVYNGGKPVDTAHCQWTHYFDKPVIIRGRIGVYAPNGDYAFDVVA